MKSGIIALLAVAVALVFSVPASAQNRMKACGEEWQAMKKASQTAGKTWAAFRKECMAKGGSLSRDAGAADVKPTDKPRRKAGTGKTSGGRAAMQQRQRACAADWKADKAAGKVEKGLTWPKYWSACNARRKGASA